MITEEQIQAVVRRIVEGYAPDKIILFGSYAYGVPHENSDLDLLIIKEKAEAKSSARDLTIRHLLWGGPMPPMDIFVRTPQELSAAVAQHFTVEAEAMQKGRILYAAA
ncbi:MAG: nucleotidyltransferase domain-containing protein [Hymenobacter sp.]|nr:MAG: nucleotidyltransferase domain-containing protein [Hymenobacter sp.]